MKPFQMSTCECFKMSNRQKNVLDRVNDDGVFAVYLPDILQVAKAQFSKRNWKVLIIFIVHRSE